MTGLDSSRDGAQSPRFELQRDSERTNGSKGPRERPVSTGAEHQLAGQVAWPQFASETAHSLV